MILATHSITGAAIGYLLPQNPILAFSLGFLSHFLTDAIPHWHYPVFSAKRNPENHMDDNMEMNKWFIVDLLDISLDFAIGLAISIFIFHPEISFDPAMVSILSGAIGGVIPDPLQFLYWKFPNHFIIPLQRFHLWIHSTTDIDKMHLIGIISQAGFAALVIWTALHI